MLKMRLILVAMLSFCKSYAQVNLYEYYENQRYLNSIYIDGEGYFTKKDLMESYFNLHPSKVLEGTFKTINSPRGYHTMYKIENNGFYIKDFWVLKGDDDGLYTNMTQKVFPKKSDRKMDWYSGLILFCSGKTTLNYIFVNYEKNVLVEINKGNVVANRHFNLEQILDYKARLFQLFKKTEQYEILRKEARERGWEDNTTDIFYQNTVLDYYNTMVIK
ncbi:MULTISPECIES: hypothetical protein [Elizabethkingia]|nr:hypothetical protein [Elizabethkingia sp. HX YK]MCT3656427.1 hypothetical protein [Elizabethkingia anophelis]MCT4116538.1 hypothetical protein [Elizabethkingia anophelis]MCT4159761.1 hypothetical protein [Elizabethkingia anophelis]